MFLVWSVLVVPPSVVVSHAVHCLSHRIGMWHDVAADCVVLMLVFRPKWNCVSAETDVPFGRCVSPFRPKERGEIVILTQFGR